MIKKEPPNVHSVMSNCVYWRSWKLCPGSVSAQKKDPGDREALQGSNSLRKTKRSITPAFRIWSPDTSALKAPSEGPTAPPRWQEPARPQDFSFSLCGDNGSRNNKAGIITGCCLELDGGEGWLNSFISNCIIPPERSAPWKVSHGSWERRFYLL